MTTPTLAEIEAQQAAAEAAKQAADIAAARYKIVHLEEIERLISDQDFLDALALLSEVAAKLPTGNSKLVATSLGMQITNMKTVISHELQQARALTPDVTA